MTSRLKTCFAELKAQHKKALVTFVTAGDPDMATSLAAMHAMVANGSDVLELGMPFSDPMADGPVIQQSSLRALSGGMTLAKTLAQVAEFRQKNQKTPVILMGYCNPVLAYGISKFSADASAAGVDGLILVDLPPEEQDLFAADLRQVDLPLIGLVAPTSDEKRIREVILPDAGGFIYVISVKGVTGGKQASANSLSEQINMIRRYTDLPIVVGFGIKTAEQAKEVAYVADGVVVGSALVQVIADYAGEREGLLPALASFAGELSHAVHQA